MFNKGLIRTQLLVLEIGKQKTIIAYRFAQHIITDLLSNRGQIFTKYSIYDKRYYNLFTKICNKKLIRITTVKENKFNSTLSISAF